MKITVVQPPYYAGERPDEKICDFLLAEMEKVEKDGLIVLPEYSNAGGLSDKDAELAALPRAKSMLARAAEVAREKSAYVVINVLETREGKLKNSSYLFNKAGDVAFIYNKQHLPPSEVKLGVEPEEKCNCICDLDGMRFAFMTCYDVYFNEQIEYIAMKKPDIIIVPGYQRGERTDIIVAQAKLLAFRTNAFVLRSSFSMGTKERGGNTMIVAPNGEALANLEDRVGKISIQIDPKEKYMRPAGYGQGLVRNDDFINNGLRKEAFKE